MVDIDRWSNSPSWPLRVFAVAVCVVFAASLPVALTLPDVETNLASSVIVICSLVALATTVPEMSVEETFDAVRGSGTTGLVVLALYAIAHGAGLLTVAPSPGPGVGIFAAAFLALGYAGGLSALGWIFAFARHDEDGFRDPADIEL